MTEGGREIGIDAETGQGGLPSSPLGPVAGNAFSGADPRDTGLALEEVPDDGGIGSEDPDSPGPAARNSAARRMMQRQARARHARAARLRPRIGLRLGIFLFLLFGLLFGAGWLVSGRTFQLPGWIVAELEDRINHALVGSHLPPGAQIEIGGIELGADPDLSPRLALRDLQVIEPDGTSLLTLPEVRLTVAGAPLLAGQIRPRSLRLSGARMVIARDTEGRIALSFGGLSGAPGVQSAAELLDAIDRMFSSPALSHLRMIEADGLMLTLDDARAGRVWQVGDGRLSIENREGSVAGDLGFSLLSTGQTAQARVTLESSKSDSSARLWARVDNMPAQDLALQAAPLTFLSVIDAPISGELQAELDAKGDFGRMFGKLSLGAGHLDPAALRRDAEDAPAEQAENPADHQAEDEDGPDLPSIVANGLVSFEQSSVSMSYDPASQRITLEELSVESDTLRIKASGTADLLDGRGQPAAPGELPKQLVTQLSFSDVMVDPEGLFQEPVRFSAGSASYRLWLNPFRIDLGSASLIEGDEQISLSGHATFDETRPVGARWDGGVDVRLNHISTDRLIRLWPVSAVPKTRSWLSENVGQGELTDVAAALRLRPGRQPRFALDYEFSGAEVRFIRTLPPVLDGRGRANILDNVYTLVLEGGHVNAPEGGEIDVEGSVFQVLDITQKPAQAEVRLVTHAGLTATLSLLDQEPFRFISKAGQRTDIGQGQADLVAELRFPLVQKIMAADVFFDVTGVVRDFTSDRLVPGKSVKSPSLSVHVTPRNMQIEGKGTLEGMPVSATYQQNLGPASAGTPAKVKGTAQISDAAMRRLGVELPSGWLSGETSADVALEIAKGSPVRLTLNSALKGLRLSIPPLSYGKAAGTAGSLSLTALLSDTPEITGFSLSAPGLDTAGKLTTRKGAGLDRLSLSRLKVGGWLDATAEITGQGKGRSPQVRLTGGTLDLRRLPQGGAGGGEGGSSAGGTALNIGLDRLIVTEGVSLTGLSGAFMQRNGGLDGKFVAAINGIGQIQGATVPYRGSTAVRITAQDAGRVMAAAGIFDKGRGGTLDMTLQPLGPEGQYRGNATFKDLSVQNAPALAALLSAASVVGLLEQMQGQGILFSEGDASFDISKAGVQIRQGAAVGASMGISFEGLYNAQTERVNIQGTISPIYLLNGIGQIFTRKGEGLFGFNYQLTGSAKNPQVSVNPLSILTPGMFRDLFRRPAPKLRTQG